MRMYTYPIETLKVIVVFFTLTVIFSCNKDSDLLAEYVSLDSEEVIGISSFIMNDKYTISRDKSIVLDVLSNDTFINLDKVKIVETSEAKNGMIVINDDNTLTYTPSNSVSPTTPSESTAETPTSETPSTETPTTETPTNETPTNETPTTETPTNETPTTGTPTTETSTTETPSTETPTTETPTSEPEESTYEETTDSTSSNEEVSDTFTYTTEEENEDGSVTTGEGTVTIVITEESETETTEVLTIEDAYYVSPTGNSGNDGKSQAAPWSLSHAVNTAIAGDTIFIQSGTYNLSKLIFSRNGTNANPIVFIGYDQNPGDIISQAGSTYNLTDTPSTSKMPNINIGNTQSGAGITVSGNYIELHNLLVSESNYGFRIQGSNNTIDNCVATLLGRSGDLAYEGIGIYVTGYNNTIQNSHVSKACAEGFNGKGRGNNFLFNEGYYVQNYETDYIFALKGDGTGGVFKGNKAYKNYVGRHQSRAFCLKGGNNYTLLDNYGYKCQLQINNSSNNLIDGLVLEGNSNTQIEIQNNANNNVIKNFYIESDYSGLIFNNNVEFSPGMGRDNIIYNGVFKGGNRSILVRDDAGQGASLTNALIANVVFDGQSGVLEVSSPVNNLDFTNCIFVNQSNSRRTGGRSPEGADISYSHCSFANNNWATPSGTNLINEDPLFTNSGSQTEQYQLQSGSSLIDAGIAVSDRNSDINGRAISGNPDIGIYEH